jgi:hypothetical protein
VLHLRKERLIHLAVAATEIENIKPCDINLYPKLGKVDLEIGALPASILLAIRFSAKQYMPVVYLTTIP